MYAKIHINKINIHSNIHLFIAVFKLTESLNVIIQNTF